MSRRHSAREAQFTGDLHEGWTITQHEVAVRLGILAHFEHSEPHTSIVRGQTMRTSAGVADFFGTLEGGRSYAAECKSIKGNRMPRNMVEKKQAEHLDAVARAGGLSLLVGAFRLDSVIVRFACPWLDVPWQVLQTAESVSPTVMAPWVFTASTTNLCFLQRWHPGGPRSGTWSPNPKRVYQTE